MEYPKEPKFYSDKEQIVYMGDKENSMFQSIDTTLKRIESVLIELKNQSCVLGGQVPYHDCKSLEDFEAFLRKEIPNNLEENTIRTLHELQKLQRPKLKNFRTCELVEELKNREGVETHMAEPYGNVELEVDGPAIVLVVID